MVAIGVLGATQPAMLQVQGRATQLRAAINTVPQWKDLLVELDAAVDINIPIIDRSRKTRRHWDSLLVVCFLRDASGVATLHILHGVPRFRCRYRFASIHLSSWRAMSRQKTSPCGPSHMSISGATRSPHSCHAELRRRVPENNSTQARWREGR